MNSHIISRWDPTPRMTTLIKRACHAWRLRSEPADPTKAARSSDLMLFFCDGNSYKELKWQRFCSA